MNSFFDNLRRIYIQGTAVMRLIYLNIALFIGIKITALILILFNVPVDVAHFVALPSSPSILLLQPWTLVTYMFLHTEFMHIFFNMIMLYWFGKIALEERYNNRQIVTLYILGGLAGAALYLLAYNLLPYYVAQPHTYLQGASAAVLAICVSVATSSPQRSIRLFLVGQIRLVWVAVAMVAISLFSITSGNAGGELAHLGGALMGYLFGTMKLKGRDISKIFDFKRKPKAQRAKFHFQKGKPARSSRKNDAASTATDTKTTAPTDAEIDVILDKIKQRGYASLTNEEKEKLFKRKAN